MATIKSYVDLEQSKKLAEILPFESADMIWANDNDVIVVPYDMATRENVLHDFIPCWSLSALLDILPTKLQIVLAINDFQGDRKEKYFIGSVEHYKYNCYADNPIDACFELIIKLNELKRL